MNKQIKVQTKEKKKIPISRLLSYSFIGKSDISFWKISLHVCTNSWSLVITLSSHSKDILIFEDTTFYTLYVHWEKTS